MHTDYNPKWAKEMKDRIVQIERFSEKALTLFRLWTKEAQLAFPNDSVEIINEQSLIQSIISHFESAIDSLLREEYEEDRKIKGWSIGFIGGHIEGALSVDWSVKYLPKPDEYLQTIWLKSLRQYFEVYTEAAHHVNRIYTSYLVSNELLEDDKEEEIEIEEIKTYNSYYKTIADMNFDSQYKELISFLKALEIKHIKKFVGTQKKIKINNFFEVFNVADIQFIMES